MMLRLAASGNVIADRSLGGPFEPEGGDGSHNGGGNGDEGANRSSRRRHRRHGARKQ